MSDRITSKDLEARVASVNRRLEQSGYGVRTEGRYGYTGLDEVRLRDGAIMRTIRTGTKREIGEFLHAMMVGIDLYRYSEEA